MVLGHKRMLGGLGRMSVRNVAGGKAWGMAMSVEGEGREGTEG